MKKISYALCAITIIVFLGFLSACYKKANMVTNNITPKMQTEQSIKEFMAKYITKKKTRSIVEDPMQYEDAEMAIEAALNFTYARVNYSDDIYNKHHHFAFNKSSTSSELSADLINNIYNEALDSLKAIDASYGSTNRQLTLVDMKIDWKSTGTVLVDVNTFFAITLVNCPNEQGDWTFSYSSGGWHWNTQGGFWTDPNTSQFAGFLGAPEMLTAYAQHNYWGNLGWNLGYFTNVVSPLVTNNNWTPNLNDYMNNPVSDNPYHTAYPSYITNTRNYISYSNTGCNNFCNFDTEVLQDYAMNYYTSSLVYLVSSILPSNNLIPTGNIISSFRVIAGSGLNIGQYPIYHFFEYSYGNFHANNQNAQPLNQ